jgi:hypothetical protein
MRKYSDEPSSEEQAAKAGFATYCEEHPRSPAAMRRPRIMNRGKLWIALLGSTLEDGIAGIGPTVEAALRAFDVQYKNALKSSR